MVFNTPVFFGWVVLGGVLVWLLVLSFFLYRTRRHYNSLTQGVSGIRLSDALERILEEVKKTQKNVMDLQRETKTLRERTKRFIQKIRLKRYNPFKDVGGDQSFILGLMDEEDSGVIISSLHSRENTRWYAKEIIKGKGKKYKLSKEEKDAISQK